MTPTKLARLKELQDMPWRTRTAEEEGELTKLRIELAANPERADDPATLFVDESSRPRLDGTDYNTRLQQIRDEECERIATRVFEKLVAAGLTLLVKR